MTTLREAATQALEALNEVTGWQSLAPQRVMDEAEDALAAIRAALEQPERRLTDEVIADLWHQNGGFHHHFARAIERWLRG